MKFGLIGYPLSHSFSKIYFTEKFRLTGHQTFTYDLIPVADENDLASVLQQDYLGFNVTIPYKSRIIQFINDIDPVAYHIGAVNTIVKSGRFSHKGYNTDYLGFKTTIENWYGKHKYPDKALVLGNGGGAKAVCYALQQLGISPSVVSRSGKGMFLYEQLTAPIIEQHLLIINTTPLGMWPDEQSCPPIPYASITSEHRAYDLVYNPANTLFLSRCEQHGALTLNGLDMLHQQAEQAWLIWKKYGKF